MNYGAGGISGALTGVCMGGAVDTLRGLGYASGLFWKILLHPPPDSIPFFRDAIISLHPLGFRVAIVW